MSFRIGLYAARAFVKRRATTYVTPSIPEIVRKEIEELRFFLMAEAEVDDEIADVLEEEIEVWDRREGGVRRFRSQAVTRLQHPKGRTKPPRVRKQPLVLFE